MPESPVPIYWDACIFLHFIEADPQWIGTLDAILESASLRQEVVIYTSSVSITEVAFAQAEKSGRTLDAAVEAAIDALWADRSVVKIVEYNEIIARSARGLLRRSLEARRRLKPMDAIHLATALIRHVVDFHTTDGQLQADWQDLGFPVRNPVTLQPKLL